METTYSSGLSVCVGISWNAGSALGECSGMLVDTVVLTLFGTYDRLEDMRLSCTYASQLSERDQERPSVKRTVAGPPAILGHA